MRNKQPQLEFEGDSITFKVWQQYGFSVDLGLWGPQGQFSHFNLNRHTKSRIIRVLREAIQGTVSLLPSNSTFGREEAMLLLTPDPTDPEHIWIKVSDFPALEPSFEYLGLTTRADLQSLCEFIDKYAL